MAVSRPDVSIDLEVSNSCDSLLLTDDTGTYNVTTNPLGYGLPSGPAVNDVTGLTIVLTFDTQDTYITFDFTIASGVITAATLSVAGATAVDILSELASTTWPLTDFDFFRDYGVTIPAFELGVHSVDYTISGLVSPASFSFTTSKSILNECSVNCCIQQKFAGIDVSCGCSNKEVLTAMVARGYLMAATYAAQSGDTANAVLALNKANELCDAEGDCGCS